MDRVLSLGLHVLVLVLLSVGLFRLAAPPPQRAVGQLLESPAETASSTSDAARRRPDDLPGVDGLYLVRDAPDPAPSPSAGAVTADTPPRGGFASGEEVPLSRLPFRLIGTVIGPSGYRSAVLEHTGSGAIRSLPPGRAWEELRVQRVEEERIRIHNSRKNRLEVLRLARTDTAAPASTPVRNVQGPDSDRDDQDRTTRERSARRSRDEDQSTFPEKKQRKNRETMKKLQEILKERRER